MKNTSLQLILATTLLVLTSVPALSQNGGDSSADHFTRIDRAVEVAQEKNKDILVDFTGSDWCGWCKRLKKEVFSKPAWKKFQKKNLVFVTLDFPRGKQLSKEQEQYNSRMKSKFNVPGFPTIYLLDSSGKPYAKTGYERGGADAYIQHVKKLQKRKKTISNQLSKAGEKEGDEKINVLEDLLEQLQNWSVSFGHPEVKEKLVAADEDNEKGLRLKYADQLALHYYKDKKMEKAKKYLNIVKELDQKKAKLVQVKWDLSDIRNKYLVAKKWKKAVKELDKVLAKNPTGRPGQFAYYYAGYAHTKLQNRKKARDLLTKGIELDPDSKIAGKMKQYRQRLK